MISGTEEEANTPGTDVSAVTERLLVFLSRCSSLKHNPPRLCAVSALGSPASSFENLTVVSFLFS